MNINCADHTPEEAGTHHCEAPDQAEPAPQIRPFLSRLTESLTPRCPICRSRHLRSSGRAFVQGRQTIGHCVCMACGIKFQPSLLQTILMRRAAQINQEQLPSRATPLEPAWSFQPRLPSGVLPELFYETLREDHLTGACRRDSRGEPERPTDKTMPQHVDELKAARPDDSLMYVDHQQSTSSNVRLDRVGTCEGPANAELLACLHHAVTEAIGAATALARLRWHSLELRTRPGGRNRFKPQRGETRPLK